jgi:hypothetical protein
MKSLTSPDFWRAYSALPPQARPPLAKPIIFGARIPDTVRSVFRNGEDFGGFVLELDTARWPWPVPDGYLWFWIGTHDEYERLLKQN